MLYFQTIYLCLNAFNFLNNYSNPLELSDETKETITYITNTLNVAGSIYSYFEYAQLSTEIFDLQKQISGKLSNSEILNTIKTLTTKPDSIKSMSQELWKQLLVVEICPSCIQYIKNPSEYILKLAIKYDYNVLKLISKKSLDVLNYSKDILIKSGLSPKEILDFLF